jgi:hypothetical protein
MKGWFLPVLTLIFVIAKIMGYIDWSWWLVFLPSYFGILIFLGVVTGFFGILFGLKAINSRCKY